MEDLWTLCKARPLEIEIPILPPTSNHIWKQGRHGTYKTAEANQFAALASMLSKQAAMKLYKTHDLSSLKGKPIRFEMMIYRPTWRLKTADGFSRPDLDNTLKSGIDGVFNALGLNDSAVIEIRAFKESEWAEHTLCRLIFL